jgi:hypothetical protein
MRNIIGHRIGYRLAIEEIFNERLAMTFFLVRDAHWVTDDETRAGIFSPTVFASEDMSEVNQFCDKVELGVIQTEPHEANFCGWPELRRRVSRWYAAGKPPVYNPELEYEAA